MDTSAASGWVKRHAAMLFQLALLVSLVAGATAILARPVDRGNCLLGGMALMPTANGRTTLPPSEQHVCYVWQYPDGNPN